MRKFLKIFFIFLLIYSLYQMVPYYVEQYKAEKVNEKFLINKKEIGNEDELSKKKEETEDDYKYGWLEREMDKPEWKEETGGNLNGEEKMDLTGEERGKRKEDYLGWLNVRGTKISYPVMFIPNDNDYYLHRLPDGSKNYAGSIFLDGKAQGADSQNLVLYGHNMKNGSMFGRLKKFTDKGYFDEHPYIELYLDDEVRFYLIFSVRKVLKTDDKTYRMDGFDAQNYIDDAISENKYSYKENVRHIDLDAEGITEHTNLQIITLSTCTGNDKYRLVVNGICVKEASYE